MQMDRERQATVGGGFKNRLSRLMGEVESYRRMEQGRKIEEDVVGKLKVRHMHD